MANKIKMASLAFVVGLLNVFGCKIKNKNLMGHGEKILIIGRHATMLAKITEMLNQHGYHAMGKMTNEEAMTAFASATFDAVIIGGGVDNESRDLFHHEFSKINPKIKIIDAHPQTVLADLKTAFPDDIKS